MIYSKPLLAHAGIGSKSEYLRRLSRGGETEQIEFATW